MNIDKNLDTLTTGIYYRKNLWNGSATVPVILKLDKGILSANTANNQIFSSLIENVSARFTVWGTMLIVVDDKQYDFTGVGAATSPSFTAAMLQEIDETKDKSGTTLARIGVGLYGAGAVTGLAAGQVAGAGAMMAGYFSGLGALKIWQNVFTVADVTNPKSVKNFKKSAAIIIIAIIVLVFIITAIASSQF